MLIVIIYLGFFLRILVAIWNSYFGPSWGAEMDALSFHLRAVESSQGLFLNEFSVGWIYSDFLGFLYFISSDHIITGCVLSCIAWLISAILLKNSLCILLVNHKVKLMLIMVYSLLPSAILLTGITLREPYQMLLVNLAMYAALKIYFKGTTSYWFILFFAISLLATLHGALLLFGVFFITFFIFIILFLKNKKNSSYKLGILIIFLLVMLWVGISLLTSIGFDFQNGFGAAITTFQERVISIDARANYRAKIEIKDLIDLFVYILTGLFQYLFEPLPWHVSNFADMILLLENILRAWLIWCACRAIKFGTLEQKKISLFIFTSYLVMEVIWAVGTGNWGTAVRHHLPALSLLLLASFSFSKSPPKITKVYN